MVKRLSAIMILMLMLVALSRPAFAIERRHGILVGEVLKLDAATRTVVIKLADGTQHTLHFVKRTAVHGMQDSAAAARDAFHGLKQGSQIAAHYTAKGADETAEEIDNIGKDGLKATEATVTRIDRDAKTLAVKTADGAEQTYRLTDSAAKYVGKETAAGAEKSKKVTVYYTEEGGSKVVHFFKWAI